MKKSFIFLLIFLEILIALFLTIKIINERRSVLGKFSVNPIKKSNLTFTATDNLKYFYEPEAGTTQHPSDWLPFKASYSINSDSLNSIKEYFVEKPSDTYRIITLGDSFTFGENVDTVKNWPSLLEKKLNSKNKCSNPNKYEVLNLGVGGYDFEYEVERYKIRGQKYKPDLVIWLMTDFNRIYEKLAPINEQLFNSLQESGQLQKLVEKGIPYESFRLAEEEIKKELGDKGMLDYQEKAIEEIFKYYNGEMVMVPMPGIEKKNLNLVQDILNKKNNIWDFDKLTNIYTVKDATLSDGHPSEVGHEVIANDIFEYLLSNSIISCQ